MGEYDCGWKDGGSRPTLIGLENVPKSSQFLRHSIGKFAKCLNTGSECADVGHGRKKEVAGTTTAIEVIIGVGRGYRDSTHGGAGRRPCKPFSSGNSSTFKLENWRNQRNYNMNG